MESFSTWSERIKPHITDREPDRETTTAQNGNRPPAQTWVWDLETGGEYRYCPTGAVVHWWKNKDGEPHREDGPAWVFWNGERMWWIKGDKTENWPTIPLNVQMNMIETGDLRAFRNIKKQKPQAQEKARELFGDRATPFIHPKNEGGPRLNSNQVKQAIAQWCKENPNHLRSEFGDLSEKELADAANPSNWKRQDKEKYFSDHLPPMTLRNFDCRPFDAQLRAYVYSDLHDRRILKIVVRGE